MPWSEVASGLVGAVAALAANGLRRRWQETQTAKGLAVAIWEELQAVEFQADSQGNLRFAGFSSQVFDTLFADIAHHFPEDLARQVMRYHWRMKFLVERRATQSSLSANWFQLAREAQDQHQELTENLERFQDTSRWRLFLNRSSY